MRRTLSIVLLASGLSLLSPPAGAQQKTTVQVLAIASEDAFEQAQALTIALKRAVTRADGFSLGKGDFSLEVMTAALGCPLPPDAACQKKIEKKVGASKYIWGTVSKSSKKEVTAILRIYEDGEQKRDTTLKYPANLTDPSDDKLLAIAADGFARLTGEANGVVVVNAGNVNGKVFVDGKEAGTVTDGRVELTLQSGEHKVLVQADGFNDAVGTVTVRAGQSTDLALTPTAVGSAKPGGDTTHDKGREKPGNTKKLIGYGGIALGGALALTGGYFWYKSSSENNEEGWKDYVKTVPGDENPCDYAESQGRDDIVDHCKTNKQHKTLAWILTPLGLVIGGVGAYLLVTSEEKPAAAKNVKPVRVQPIMGFGPQGGQVAVDVTF